MYCSFHNTILYIKRVCWSYFFLFPLVCFTIVFLNTHPYFSPLFHFTYLHLVYSLMILYFRKNSSRYVRRLITGILNACRQGGIVAKGQAFTQNPFYTLSVCQSSCPSGNSCLCHSFLNLTFIHTLYVWTCVDVELRRRICDGKMVSYYLSAWLKSFWRKFSQK